MLPDGKVLVTGGENEQDDALVHSEVFDPASGKWTVTGPLSVARSGHIARLLPDGRVLVAAGNDTNDNPIASSELFDVGLGFTNSWRPQIATAPASSLSVDAWH